MAPVVAADLDDLKGAHWGRRRRSIRPMRVAFLGPVALLSCAVFEPTPAEPLRPPPPDECSSSAAYVAPPVADREIAVNLSAALEDLMTLQRISLCVDGALFWQIKSDLDTKVQNSLRLTPGPHDLQLVALAAGATSGTRGYRFAIRSHHAFTASSMTSLDASLYLEGDATRPFNERPKIRWEEEPTALDAGAPDR